MSKCKFWTVCVLSLMPTIVPAGEEAVRVILTQDAGAELQLEARQRPLPQILKKITEATGVPIHYSVLPKGLVTATCVGTTVKQVLECLFDKKADLIFRYAKTASKNVSLNHPAEVWVMGTNFGVEEACTTTGMQTRNPATGMKAQAGDTDGVDKLLERAKTQDPAQRADAVTLLAAEGQANDENVNSALVSALSDKNANVRAQAVSGLARRESGDAPAALQNAMQDVDVSVRLMAVGNAGDNAALLQQALSDSDETVRAYAGTKLEELSSAGKAQ
ncbi:MAG: HEAT repeat domain-containing protein [Methylobacter sp.]